MISKNLADKMIYQINREIFSGYLYLGMASYAYSINLKGFANWFKRQFKEELEHAEKMYDYLSEKGVRVVLSAIEEPAQDFNSAAELFEKTLAHEKAVTKLIHSLYDTAKQENDDETAGFLDWFVKEQIEEEATPASIIKNIERAGNSPKGLAEIDAMLLNRK
jgi:ferritin